MSGELREVRVPALGDFADVPVIAVLMKPGDRIVENDALVTLESDKASMDVPAPFAGIVREVLVQVGERVRDGSLLARVEVGASSGVDAPAGGPDGAPASDSGAGRTGDTIRLPRPDLGSGAPPASATSSDPANVSTASSPPASSPAASAPATSAPATSAPAASSPAASVPAASAATTGPAPAPTSARAASSDGEPAADVTYPLVVFGAGPGGYTAAFRAADLGLKVAIVERGTTLGGVCLNVGCIPSKALLHAAKVIEDATSMANFGIAFEHPTIDTERLRAWKNRVVSRLTSGLSALAKQRKVDVVRGDARFVSPHRLEVRGPNGTTIVGFEQCIVAAGSEAIAFPGAPQDPRIVDSTGALELNGIPRRMLVIGGGIIGLEMATVYDALGAKITVVELSPGLMPGCDRDLVRPLEKRLRARYEAIHVGTKVAGMEALPEGIRVTFEGEGAPAPQLYDRVLVSVGRRPNGRAIGAEAAGIRVDERGFVPTDGQMRTNVPHVYAIGDIAGAPMLAHKASHEGKVAAEVAAGEKRAFDARVIPSVAYTDPEVAWVGLTETEAQARGIKVGKGAFPWIASGRSLALNREEGFTKLLFDPETHRVLGAGIVGTNAGDLISEVALAIEMGADAADVGLTIHPHPTLSETIAFAAEAFEGTLTDLYVPKKG